MTPKMDRRQVVATLGTVSLGTVLAACGGDDDEGAGATTAIEPKGQAPADSSLTELFDEAGSCQLTPELTEGPYYFDVDSIRSDIREDREGTPLRLAIRVREDGSCEPLENAVVDVWHCDANGSYSGFEAASQGGPPSGGPGSGPCDPHRPARPRRLGEAARRLLDGGAGRPRRAGDGAPPLRAAAVVGHSMGGQIVTPSPSATPTWSAG